MSRRLPQPSAEATRRRLAGLLEASPDEAWEDATPPDPEPPEVPRGLLGGWRRETVLVVCAILLVGIVVGGFTLLRSRPVAVPSASATPAAPTGLGLPAARSPGATPTPSASARPSLAAHIIGEVKHPGLVSLPAGARVDDAITAAGGLTSRANPGDLNLAQPLQDGQQVVIGSANKPGGEVRGPAAPAAGTAGAATGGPPAGKASSGARINLNTASATELEKLPGVGPATAQKIIIWREQNGGFRTVEQLKDVQGIGPKTYADIAPHVAV
ncbi:helix-hairpin-helix domain-containing protein [Raineyella sp.]|uniref:helix-hairpin-helix domain-containing protein n=1 Tax=Raineyella sp. TaxID=1911550 RepID=UPI002B1F54D8|nr:helix-hairpin-helix domain-containing protein [Raineyella sp.]MEA5155095.1 helix-hairpin-helix domain-containing protein [Raineyella sp.]